MASGVPVLVHRRPGALAHLGWFVRGGAAHEPADASGLTSLMTRVSLKGTLRRSAQRIAEDAEFLGGVLSTAAAADGFQWTISVPRRRIEEAAELLADVVQRPSFSEDAVESERAVMLANLVGAARRHVSLAAPPRHRGGVGRAPVRPVGAGHGGIARGDGCGVRCVAGTRRSRSRRRACSCASVTSSRTRAPSLATRFFSGLRAADAGEVAVPVWPDRLRTSDDRRDKAQSALAMLFEGPGRGDDARFSAGLIAGVASGLGGRFFDELRDRQSLAYTVMAAPIVRRRAGAFSAYIAMSPEKEDAARSGLLREFARLRESPVTERELEQAKTYALGTWAIRRESAAAVMGDIADAWLFGRSLDRAVGVRRSRARRDRRRRCCSSRGGTSRPSGGWRASCGEPAGSSSESSAALRRQVPQRPIQPPAHRHQQREILHRPVRELWRQHVGVARTPGSS